MLHCRLFANSHAHMPGHAAPARADASFSHLPSCRLGRFAAYMCHVLRRRLSSFGPVGPPCAAVGRQPIVGPSIGGSVIYNESSRQENALCLADTHSSQECLHASAEPQTGPISADNCPVRSAGPAGRAVAGVKSCRFYNSPGAASRPPVHELQTPTPTCGVR